jgi:hypothetical protein
MDVLTISTRVEGDFRPNLQLLTYDITYTRTHTHTHTHTHTQTQNGVSTQTRAYTTAFKPHHRPRRHLSGRETSTPKVVHTLSCTATYDALIHAHIQKEEEKKKCKTYITRTHTPSIRHIPTYTHTHTYTHMHVHETVNGALFPRKCPIPSKLIANT